MISKENTREWRRQYLWWEGIMSLVDCDDIEKAVCFSSSPKVL